MKSSFEAGDYDTVHIVSHKLVDFAHRFSNEPLAAAHRVFSLKGASVSFLLVAVVCIYLAVLSVYRRWLSPLSRFPGPFLASTTRLWYTYIMWRGLQHEVFPALHEKYGRYVRVAPNELHITDPAYLRTIYGAGSKHSKTDFFKVFQGTRKFDLVSERDQRIHAAQKKLVARAYSLSSVRKLEGGIDATLDILLEKFDALAGRSFDVSTWIQFWSFDTIGMVTFSKIFGFLETGRDWNQALLQIRDAMDCAAWLGQNPGFYTFCQEYIFPITGNFFAIANRHGSIRKFAIQQAAERQTRDMPEQPDLMQSLLQVHRSKASFDTEALQSMVTTNIFGGAETTASSMRASLYFILKHPECEARLIDEIDRHCTQATIVPGQIVPFAVAEKMQYLQAVILEAMRLFPANGIPSGRVVPQGGLEIDGKHVPAGTEVTIFSWCLHRDPKVFGHSAKAFDPDRLLASATDYHYFQQNFFSFGSGSRICLGRSLAWMEMTKGLATLFRRYKIQLSRPNREWTVDGSFIKGQRDIEILLTRREVEV